MTANLQNMKWMETCATKP